MPSPPFRPGTQVGETKISFILNSGGIGDYINWVTSIRYAITVNPHISGYIITQPYFADLAHLWFDNYSERFEVREVETDNFAKIDFLNETAMILPNQEQYANASGFNLFQLGFIFYNQIDRAPEGWRTLPEIRGNEITPPDLPKDYVVLTPNATADNRRLTANCLNGLIAYFREKGSTPVLLGKHSIAGDYVGSASDGLNLEGCLDLREKTSLREAACIMAGAKLTLGLDNGLLHLASCGPAPVAWVFTTIEPRLRLPPRPRQNSKVIVIAPSERLTCRFCQSRMRYVIGHKFDKCLYGDNLCVNELKAEHITGVIEKEWGAL